MEAKHLKTGDVVTREEFDQLSEKVDNLLTKLDSGELHTVSIDKDKIVNSLKTSLSADF